MNGLRASLVGLLLALGACAADVTPEPASARAALAPPLPQPSPVHARSPVDTFRELLAMDSTARAAALANRAPDARQRLLAKLREYSALAPDERELRLHATELRWYLLPLLAAPATNRAALLDRVPADLRPLVDNRLTLWSITPPSLRQELLEDDRQMRLYLQLEASTPTQQQAILQALPPNQRQEIAAGFDRWHQLPTAERQRIIDRVDHFFDLTGPEKTRVLASFSEPERRQMARTLQAFEQLPPDKRGRCLQAFGKFASLAPQERAEFLRNAERWQAMTPAEREKFRTLVQQAPMLPPPPQLEFPPLPPGAQRARATNAH